MPDESNLVKKVEKTVSLTKLILSCSAIIICALLWLIHTSYQNGMEKQRLLDKIGNMQTEITEMKTDVTAIKSMLYTPVIQNGKH